LCEIEVRRQSAQRVKRPFTIALDVEFQGPKARCRYADLGEANKKGVSKWVLKALQSLSRHKAAE